MLILRDMNIQRDVRALLAEDDPDIRDLIKSEMEALGLTVVLASNGKLAIDLIRDNHFEIFVLDRMLPEVTGLEVCKHVRSHPLLFDRPILMVTAMTLPHQIVEGLEAGADDYVTKPFDVDVLMARLKAALRRYQMISGKTKNQDKIHFGPFMMDLKSRRFVLEESEVSLTKSEFTLLSLLILNIGKVMSREELRKAVQGDDTHVTNRTIDTHIFGLRKKLRHYSSQVESVRGIGYRVNESV